MTMQLKSQIKLQNNDQYILIPACADAKNWHPLVDSWISAQMHKQQIKLKVGEIHLLYPNDHQTVVVFGLGNAQEITATKVRRASAVAVKSLIAKKPKHLALHLIPELMPFLQSLAEGIGLANYQPAKFKTSKNSEEKPQTIESLMISSSPKLSSEQIQHLKNGLKIADSVNLVRDLVNAPPNYVNPKTMAEQAKKLAKNSGFKVSVIEKVQLEKLGLGALLGVNRGSEIGAKLVVMEYSPPKVSGKPIALVGKGVTFDTGGINLKPSDAMDWMKMDMAGAAVVLGVFNLLRDLKVRQKVIGLLPLTDNSVDALAQKPQDIVTSFSGKTIEIGNTDAEGRLILADAISYAIKKYQPAQIVDIATLTGACMIALGDCLAGLFGNNVDLIKQLQASAERTGEEVWHLPIHEKHREEMKGKFADLNNVSGSRLGGASTAAAFLEEFVEKTPWAHLDIAGVAKPAKVWDTEHDGATGFGVRLLIDFLLQ